VIRAGLPPKQSLSIFRAEQDIAARCMAARGYRFIAERQPVFETLPPTTFRPNPGGPPSEAALLAYRKRHGFGAAGANAPQTLSPTDKYLESLPTAARTRWLRSWVSPNGCSAYPLRELFGGVVRQQADIMAINTAYNFIIDFIQRSPKVRASTERWSRCLARATGRSWTSEPAVVVATARMVGNGRPPSPAQAAIAVADTRCAYSTGQATTYAQAVQDGARAVPARIAQSVSQAYGNYLGALARSSPPPRSDACRARRHRQEG
jgi:hypothetical protein